MFDTEKEKQFVTGFSLPHTITNKHGEELIFRRIEQVGAEQRVIAANRVQPGAGPPMHVHFHQDEHLRVVRGKMGYQIEGEDPRFLEPGQSATFSRGMPHRFWAEGDEVLECEGWIQPVHNVVFFLDAIYKAINAGQGDRPEAFDSAYLLTRYRSEYDLTEIPAFVKRVIMPVQVMMGRMLGKYRKFDHAPEPLRP